MPSTKLAAQLRRKETSHYEDDTPRCSNCVNRGFNRDQVSICRLHSFANEAAGLCDDWTGKDGAKLEQTK